MPYATWMLPMSPAAAAERSSLPFQARSNRRQHPGSACQRPPERTSSLFSPSLTRCALCSDSTAAGRMTSVTVTSSYIRLARLSTAARWDSPDCCLFSLRIWSPPGVGPDGSASPIDHPRAWLKTFLGTDQIVHLTPFPVGALLTTIRRTSPTTFREDAPMPVRSSYV